MSDLVPAYIVAMRTPEGAKSVALAYSVDSPEEARETAVEGSPKGTAVLCLVQPTMVKP